MRSWRRNSPRCAPTRAQRTDVPDAAPVQSTLVRERLRVRGRVQGVGFRPFVYRVARELELAGWVRNDAEGVLIEAQGAPARLELLAGRLVSELPPLAWVERIERSPREPEPEPGEFRILASAAGTARTGVTPDAATCPDCLAELFNPADRRYRYPFINCTHCGPRYTITRRIPYDRPNTVMAGFELCSACAAEYADPADRRFHAQPTACPDCGPRLEWRAAQGVGEPVADVIAHAVERLRQGDILAVKGLGGFHLVCDARNGEAVARLRERKQREEKPFAVMAANTASFAQLVAIGSEAEALLSGIERPIVLCPKRPGCDAALAGVAPGVAALGVMLPYTPLHWLLFHEAAGRPDPTGWMDTPGETLLVMTSANPGGEPLVIDNDEAIARLAAIADGFVLHDRPIEVRCDDSVLRMDSGAPTFVRRARGFTPRAIKLPAGGSAVLALGGALKNTVCLTRGDEAFIAQHVGDLDNPAACGFLEDTVAHLSSILEVVPERIACDLHPDFFSSRLAARLAAEAGIDCIPVQHHHAHIAAVAAERGLTGPLLGLALDGVGLGSDRTPWGGELLLVEGARFSRAGHLRTLPLPGGDRAAREPWRMAAAALHRLGLGDAIERRFPHVGAPLAEMLSRGINCPETGSAGRWFDAAAGLLGVRETCSFEGQAAMLLEGLAEQYGPVDGDRTLYAVSEAELDLLPLLGRLAETDDAPFGAALFHATLIEGLAEWVRAAAEVRGLNNVVLAGGCFLNSILSRGLRERLERAGLHVHQAHELPPNDGGISLGQAWVAMQA